MHTTRFHAAPRRFTWLFLALATGLAGPGRAADHGAVTVDSTHAAPASKSAASAPVAKSVGEQVREAVAGGAGANKRVTLMINGKEKKFITIPAGRPVAAPEAAQKSADSGHNGAPPAMTPAATPKRGPPVSRQYLRARTAALTGHSSGRRPCNRRQPPVGP